MSDDEVFAAMTQEEQFFELVLLGHPVRLAAMEVKWTPRQLRLKMQDPEFAEIVEYRKECRDDGVEAMLYKLAQKGNMNAIQMVLLNRRPGEWRDTKKIEITNETTINFGQVRSIKEAVRELIQEGGVAALQPGGVIDVESEEMVE